MFDLRLIPLFLVKHPIIAFNLDSPKINAMKEVPNLHLIGELLRNSHQEHLFSIEPIINTSWTPHTSCMMKVVHYQTTGLNAIPKLVFNQFACCKKNTFLTDGDRRNACPPLINHDNLVPNKPHECNLFATVCQILDLRPVSLVIPWKITWPFVCRSSHSNDLIDD